MKIKAKEKVGVVGRTGAGKSSLMLALFRFVELDSGKIVIDGHDISEMNFTDLRKGLSIIPQDPTLFTGTIRSNLDPFTESSDGSIWDALRSVHLNKEIENLPEKLDAPVTEGKVFEIVNIRIIWQDK
jgi:ATP-binding cassette, subfamily C (CFTR/MRP), member 1